MQKSIYFANRNPHLTGHWPSHWRRHGALAMSKPLCWSLWKYSHCDPIDGLRAEFETRHIFDGVGICWFRGGGDLSDGIGDAEGLELMMIDERETFASNVGQFAILATETVLKEEWAPIECFLLAIRKSARFKDSWRQQFATARLDDKVSNTLIKRLSLNRADPSEYTANSIMRGYDGVAEMSFTTIENATSFFCSEQYRATRQAVLPDVVVDKLVIATHGNLFYDSATGRDESATLIREYL